MTARVSGVWVHPIKSCRGIARQSLRVSPEGVDDDRIYVVADEAGQFVTGRTEPNLLRVEVEDVRGGFCVRAPGFPPLELLHEEALTAARNVTVWRNTVRALEHEAGSAYFSAYLRRPVRLLRRDELRRVNPERARPEHRVAFADAYPLLAISTGSLWLLNEKLKEKGLAPVPMERFRPNVVLEGLDPHAEDELREFRLDTLTFSMPKACDRCVMTTVDQATGTPGKEPLATLASYRRSEGKVWFGVNLLVHDTGVLRIGAELTNQS